LKSWVDFGASKLIATPRWEKQHGILRDSTNIIGGTNKIRKKVAHRN
jgi:hypothetical protein